MIPDDPTDMVEGGPVVVAIDPPSLTAGRFWIAGVGVLLPYVTVAIGWCIAEMAAGGERDNTWWEDAGTWVCHSTLLALAICAWLCRPMLLLARSPGRISLIILAISSYVVSLFVVNLWSALAAGAPFP